MNGSTEADDFLARSTTDCFLFRNYSPIDMAADKQKSKSMLMAGELGGRTETSDPHHALCSATDAAHPERLVGHIRFAERGVCARLATVA